VDDQRRAGEQADRDDQRLHAPSAELELGEDGPDRDRRAVQHRLDGALIEQQRDDRDRGDVRPQQPQQDAVPRPPLTLGQRAAMRQLGTEMPGCVP
jgi:hypothetical protein